MVDEEQVRVARDLGRAVGRVVDRHDERSGASQSVVMTWRSGGGTNEATVTTTSAPATASRADAATRTPAIPSVARASSASDAARAGSRS